MDTRAQCKECGAPLSTAAHEGLCPKCLLKAAMGTLAGGSEGNPTVAAGGVGLLDPAILARYFPQLEILELLGQGGMGAVYKARQSGLDRFVALKVLPPQPGADPGFAERFNQEARALAKLSHPNIVAVYDFGQVNGGGIRPASQASAQGSMAAGQAPGGPKPADEHPALHYLLMEYVDGPNLRQVEQAGRLSPREALQIIPQLCEALQFAHDEGIVHRDIKPENVLLDKKGRVKVADFGLAKILGREPNWRLTGARDIMGTPNYMAPEQLERPLTVDHRADIYSLGVVFYEMLTGELPLGRFAPPSQKAQIDVRLDEVVLRTLEKEPERRYQHISEVKTDVETITRLGGAFQGTRPTERRPATSKPELWKTSVGILAATVTVLLLAWIFMAVTGLRLRGVQQAKTPPANAPGPGSLIVDRGTGVLAEANVALPEVPPVVVKTVPESGISNVDPNLTELQVTFSAPMEDGNFAWTTWGEENFPKVTGSPRFLPDGRTCVLPVKLEPGKVYATWINSEHHMTFQDRRGLPAVPYLLIFETRK